MPAPAQSVLVDLLVLAVSKTALKDLVPADEFRARVDADYATFTDGGRLRLQKVWEIFAPVERFDAKVAACPMCWLKSLESRIGMPVDLPTELAGFKTAEVATQAAKFFIKKDDVDKLLGPDTGPPARTATPVPGVPVSATREPGAPPVREPGAPPLEPGAPPLTARPSAPVRPGGELDLPNTSLRSVVEDAVRMSGAINVSGVKAPPGPHPTRNKLIGVAAGVIALGALAVMAGTLRSGCAKPAATFQAAALKEIPVKDGKRRGAEVSVTLTDPTWMTSPEADRKAQLGGVLDDLRPNGVESLVVLDSSGQLLASAQYVSGSQRIRFYR